MEHFDQEICKIILGDFCGGEIPVIFDEDLANVAEAAAAETRMLSRTDATNMLLIQILREVRKLKE